MTNKEWLFSLTNEEIDYWMDVVRPVIRRGYAQSTGVIAEWLGKEHQESSWDTIVKRRNLFFREDKQ